MKANPKKYGTYLDKLKNKLLLGLEDDDFQVATRGVRGKL
jgi:hypothetical protein